MIGIYYGNEPYLIQIEKNKYVKGIQNPEMNLIKGTSMTEDILDFLYTYPIMDKRRIAILDIDSLSQLDCKEFKHYIKEPSDFSDLFIIVRSLDNRTKFAKELGKCGLLHECKKLNNASDVINYLLPVIKHAGGRITEDAMKEFMARENYLEADINLLHMVNDLNSLLTIDKDITLPMVTTYIRKNEVENCFAIAKMISDKNFSDLKRQSELINSSDIIGVLSLLLREYRIAWKLHAIDGFKAKYAVFKDKPIDEIFQGLVICQDAIDSIKTGRMPSDELLHITLMKLSLNHK